MGLNIDDVPLTADIAAHECWRALAENALDTVTVVDSDGRILFVNRSLAGGPRDRYPGTTLFEYAAETEHEAIRAVLRQVFDEGATVKTVSPGYGPAGTIAWYEHRVAPIRRDGVVIQALIVSTDITLSHDAAVALHQSEASHRLLFDDNPAALWVVEEGTHRFLAVNNAALRRYGFTRDEFLSMTALDLRPPEEIPRLLAALANRRNTFEPVGTWRHRRKDGSLIDVEVIRHETTYHGRRAWLVASIDVTMRKRAAEAILRSRRELEALSRRLLEAEEAERRRIARELHDEAGQTLTGMLVGLRALEKHRTVTEMREAARKLRELCSGLIHDIGRLARGLHPTVLDDLGLPAALKKLAQDQAEAYGAAITVDLDGIGHARLPAGVQTALFRIAQEACSNSLNAGKAARVTITVRNGGENIEMEVRDNGNGFDVPKAGAQAAQSGRLGLVGMRERAALLGGELTIESEPGKGALIRARIPLSGT